MPAFDSGLLKRAQGGDRSALTRLLEQEGPRVRQGLAGKIPSAWQSVLAIDDVMQQTYADAFLDIHQFRPQGRGSFHSWLATLAGNNLQDALRTLRAKKRGDGWHRVAAANPDDSMSSLLDWISSGGPTPSSYAARQEACSLLRGAIERLSESYRAVVEMYDLQGLPVEEVAGLMGRSIGAVFMMRARAHQRLAEKMGRASQFLTG